MILQQTFREGVTGAQRMVRVLSEVAKMYLSLGKMWVMLDHCKLSLQYVADGWQAMPIQAATSAAGVAADCF